MDTSASQEFAVVGTRPIRHDGFDKVTGRALYGADIHLAGLLHGRVLRSPHAHARILSINTANAKALPGVKAIVTAHDLALGSMDDAGLQETSSGFRYLSDNVLARDKVLYRGHAVAAVAAVSPHVAEQALSLIDVDYEVLPAAVNVLDAIKRMLLSYWTISLLRNSVPPQDKEVTLLNTFASKKETSKQDLVKLT